MQNFEFGDTEYLSVEVRPLIFGDPICGVGHNCDLTSGACQQIPPLRVVYLFVSLEDLVGQNSREKQFMAFEQGPADVLIKTVSKEVV